MEQTKITQCREKARELVAQMTLEEAASQLKFDAPAIPRLGIPAYNWWNEALHGVARAGTATVFPQLLPWRPCLMWKVWKLCGHYFHRGQGQV